MKEFHAFSKIELHMFTIRLQDFKLIDYSYKTHPNMKVIDAIYHTCCVPYIFKPHWYNNNYYIDGGLLNNYPVDYCLENGAKNEETLGICFQNNSNMIINEKSNLLDLFHHIHKVLIKKISTKNKSILKNQIQIPCCDNSINTFIDIINNSSTRQENIKNGEEIATQFLNRKTIIPSFV